MNKMAFKYLQAKPKYDYDEAKILAKKSWKSVEKDIQDSLRKDNDIRVTIHDLI